MRFSKIAALLAVIIGVCYGAQGLVDVADSREFTSVQELAQSGNSDAQRVLGEAYSAGYLVGRDESEALKWLTLSAKQGNPSAQLSLASLYSRMGDERTASMWLERARVNGCVGTARSVSDLSFNSL
ncbi:tetratricopeptide repeat protein [Dethiosulfovibrio salsuginis]|uniref:Sel1 repeat-containing protein n=1 Tax=Dethiosulfovibrio salsuginis TaxID=561720 RepID=A0A1X7JFN3_9BACT|nr:SEL1-like repeat protein [Dethiosulfovibrio salsuginis]SMG26554.1 hypothetical protein SAMN06275492_11154 [Dethiosulfovibrio salsuginis]